MPRIATNWKLTFLPGSIALLLMAVSTRAQPAPEEVQAKLDAATPGSSVDITSGALKLTQPLVMTKSGTAEQPITIRPRTRAGVSIEGRAGLVLKGAKHVIIEGFAFTGDNLTPAIELIDCQHVQITRNRFKLSNLSAPRQNWLHIHGGTSGSNRVDHNLFEGLRTPGAYIAIDGSEKEPFQMSKADVIDTNHFKDILKVEGGGARAIRLGWTSLAAAKGQSVIENNLFEECNGDEEMISVRSSGQTIRYNTIRNCAGYVTLRAGGGNTVEGNFFIADNNKEGAGGIRICGADARVFNNYMENLSVPAIVMSNGLKLESPAPGAVPRPAASGAAVTFNSLVNCMGGAIDIGHSKSGKWTDPPTNCLFANNMVIGFGVDLVKIEDKAEGVKWLGNIMFHAGNNERIGLNLPPDQVNVAIPKLRNPGDFWRLGPGSPAIDAALGEFDYVVSDIDGQQRTKKKDVGCDESTTGPNKYKMLTNMDVGTDAP